MISSCLRQTLTPTLGPVTPTGIKTPEEVDWVKEGLVVKATAVTEAIMEAAQLLNIHLNKKER